MSHRSLSDVRSVPANAAGRLTVLLVLAFLTALFADNQDKRFFDHELDGAWIGSIRPGSRDRPKRPLQLNVNAQSDSGLVVAIRFKNPTSPAKGFDLAAVDRPEIRRRRLVFELPSDNSLTTTAGATEQPNDEPGNRRVRDLFKLRYRPDTDTLEGTVSGVKGVGNNRVLLYRADPAAPSRRIWSGNLSIDGESRSLVLETLPVQSAVGSNRAPVTLRGFGYLGDAYGVIRNATIDGERISGELALASETLEFDLTMAAERVRGTIRLGGSRGRAKLLAAGSSGKPLKVGRIRPRQLPAGRLIDLTIRGSNFTSATLVHGRSEQTDKPAVGRRKVPSSPMRTSSLSSGPKQPEIHIRAVEFQSSRRMRVSLVADAKLQPGTPVSLRVVSASGQWVDRPALHVGEPLAVSFSADLQPVFDQSCGLTDCHAGPAPAELLNLSAGSAYDNIVDVPSLQMLALRRIDPGDPAASYLIRKLKDQEIIGQRMPSNAPALSEAVIALFEAWTLAGAERN